MIKVMQSRLTTGALCKNEKQNKGNDDFFDKVHLKCYF